MRYHPAIFMLMVWSGCLFLYLALPFQFLGRELSVVGFMIWFLFILAFCFGSLLVPQPKGFAHFDRLRIMDFRQADFYLKFACLIAIGSSCMDLLGRDLFDLTEAYADRSSRAGALMRGEPSSSTIWFRISFLTYPAGFIYLVRQILYSHKIQLMNITIFGLMPVIMVTISMGGRSPLLYAIIIAIFAFKGRQLMRVGITKQRQGSSIKRFLMFFLLFAGVVGAFYYFSAVFLVRAETRGGSAEMIKFAEIAWGVGFRGDNYDLLYSVVGDDGAYLIFAFSWYLIQGFFIQNILYTYYEGPIQFGIYGVDLLSALMRRLDGELIARNFGALNDVGTYGFLPSAFGSLYVDFNFFGLFFAMLWGWLAALVYQRIRQNDDARWFLLAPFISMGILFSLLNTPIGFSNGLVTYFWLLVAFFSAKDINATMTRAKKLKQQVNTPQLGDFEGAQTTGDSDKLAKK